MLATFRASLILYSQRLLHPGLSSLGALEWTCAQNCGDSTNLVVSLNSVHPGQYDRSLSIVALRFFDRTLLLFLFVELPVTFWTKFLATDDQVLWWMCVSRSPDHIRLEVFQFILWTAWNLSLVPISFDRHPCSKTLYIPHSGNTSKEVCVLLTASKNCSGIGNDSFFLRHMELNSWFDVMTINVSIPFDRPKIVSGVCVIHHCVYRLRPVRFSSKIISELFASFGLVPFSGAFSDTLISSRQFCCSIFVSENEMFTIFRRNYVHCIEFSNHAFLTRLNSPTSQCLATKISAFHIPARQCISEEHLTKLMESWLVFSQK